jgi:molybdenum cofactor cytidylyltransferase
MILQDIAALIPAAGFSTRMGSFKPLLPLGHGTVIERVISLFRTQGVKDIVVVLGYEASRLAATVESLGVRWVMNEDYEKDMFSSVKIGVRHFHIGTRAFFLLPVDFPLVRPETLTTLANAFLTSGLDVCRPVYQKKYGHPPLISTGLIDDLTHHQEPGGMRSFLSRYEGRTLAVECDDPGILINLNSWQDYEKACEMVKTMTEA